MACHSRQAVWANTSMEIAVYPQASSERTFSVLCSQRPSGIDQYQVIVCWLPPFTLVTMMQMSCDKRFFQPENELSACSMLNLLHVYRLPSRLLKSKNPRGARAFHDMSHSYLAIHAAVTSTPYNLAYLKTVVYT